MFTEIYSITGLYINIYLCYILQRLIVCLEESLYVHNIRDMKVIHTIRSISANPNGLCDLSCSNECSYLAYPGSSRSGTVQIFDTITLVSTMFNYWYIEVAHQYATTKEKQLRR